MLLPSWSDLILWPVVFYLAVLAIVGFYYYIRLADRQKRSGYSRIYRCADCGHVYADTHEMPLLRCPRCGCLNDPIKR